MSVFIRWRYSKLECKIYFSFHVGLHGNGSHEILIMTAAVDFCLNGLRWHRSQDCALLGAVSAWTLISYNAEDRLFFTSGEAFVTTIPNYQPKILLTSHSSLRSRTICVLVFPCSQAISRDVPRLRLTRLNNMFHRGCLLVSACPAKAAWSKG